MISYNLTLSGQAKLSRASCFFNNLFILYLFVLVKFVTFLKENCYGSLGCLQNLLKLFDYINVLKLFNMLLDGAKLNAYRLIC